MNLSHIREGVLKEIFDALLDRLKNILERNIAMDENSAFLKSMIINGKGSIESKIRLIQNRHTALIEWKCV